MFRNLNFPSYSFRVKNSENKTLIFDVIRKKFVLLTPEEWVRQHTLHFLMDEKAYPTSLLSVEKKIHLSNRWKRYDIVVYKPNGNIQLIVECKAPEVRIAQATFDQIAQYNRILNADYLMVTNGLNHYFCQMDYQKEQYLFLRDLPRYK